MTERAAELQARIASIEELREIVGALRGLAAMRTQEATHGLASTRAYVEIVRTALGRASGLLPESAAAWPERRSDLPPGVLLFCAEHSFAGGFNNRVLAAIDRRRSALYFVVGSRGLLACSERRIPVAWSIPMASHVGALTVTARRISEELYRRFSGGELGGVDIVFARQESSSRATIVRRTLLPIGLPAAANAAPPLVNCPTVALVERLLEEYLFGELAHAAMESFASENAARLATMQAARHNIEEKLSELKLTDLRLRQEEITAELLDIATGAEAQSPEPTR
jgi:F-type H+-transporting ATPase subunit gamma